MDKLKVFYDNEYSMSQYAAETSAENHGFYNELKEFVNRYGLSNKKCLEIGCGRGAFQDIVPDYTGIDVSDTVSKYIHKPFYQCSATKLPFEDDSFDAIWTITVLEHVPEPELALEEMRRVLKPNGLLFLSPAWQCRSWAADGYAVRPYSDFDLRGKLIKASIPLRDSVLFRSMYIFPQRFIRYCNYAWSKKPTRFKYKKLAANYEHFWVSDSDACNAMDPYEAILWFKSRGDKCLSFTNNFSEFFVRTGAIIFKKE